MSLSHSYNTRSATRVRGFTTATVPTTIETPVQIVSSNNESIEHTNQEQPLVEGPCMSIFTNLNLPIPSLTLQQQLLTFATRKSSKFVVRDTPEYERINLYWKTNRTYCNTKFNNVIVIKSWKRKSDTSSKVNSTLILYLSQLLESTRDCMVLKNITKPKTQQSLMKSRKVHPLSDDSFLVTI